MAGIKRKREDEDSDSEPEPEDDVKYVIVVAKAYIILDNFSVYIVAC